MAIDGFMSIFAHIAVAQSVGLSLRAESSFRRFHQGRKVEGSKVGAMEECYKCIRHSVP